MDSLLLTISKLKRWSIAYYIDTASTAERATADLQRSNGGLGEYYSERDTRTRFGCWPEILAASRCSRD
jgi:hypothetical protein